VLDAMENSKKNHFYYSKKVNFANEEFSHYLPQKNNFFLKMIKLTNIIKYEYFIFWIHMHKIEFL